MDDVNKTVKTIEALVIVGHAKKIKEYCKMNKNCKDCIFCNGNCVFQHYPADWQFNYLNVGGKVNGIRMAEVRTIEECLDINKDGV